MPTGSDFSRVDFTKQDQSYASHGDNATGEYGQVVPSSTLPDPAQDNYPNPFGYGFDANNRQFSSDVDGDPIALCQSTKPGIDAHADMQYAFGLCSPVAGLGTHGWLRDSLTNTGQKQPGNEQPHYTAQIARRISEEQGED